MSRAILQFFFIAFGVNALWEVAQTPLYQHANIFGTIVPSSLLNFKYIGILAYATLGDVFYLSLIYTLVACIEHNKEWITHWHTRDTLVALAAGFVFATAIEWRGLAEGYWSYSTLMPIIPLLHVGLSPFLQLSTTALISFYFLGIVARRYFGKIII